MPHRATAHCDSILSILHTLTQKFQYPEGKILIVTVAFFATTTVTYSFQYPEGKILIVAAITLTKFQAPKKFQYPEGKILIVANKRR